MYSAADAPPLVVEDLGRSYDQTRALTGLSFAVRAGEIVGLVGLNGAGKTTALRSIAGILPIQEGRVLVCGHDVTRDEVAAKRGLAWVPDDPQPFDSLTVEEHLEFTAALYGMRDWRARAEELLVRFELVEKRKALGGELSRGMRQKLACAQAWLPSPRLMLLDEPLSGLDPRGIRSAREAIRTLAEGGTAVLLSSHQLELIEALAERILILDRGKRVFLGTLDEARATLSPSSAGTSLEQVFLAATGALEPEAGGPRPSEP
ncbi:MAG: ABC transporter ATP-binding protein [Planctomycetes bacterium]|nr:ABC transporter ATP-binding protein [Planctomycetota bacterium]